MLLIKIHRKHFSLLFGFTNTLACRTSVIIIFFFRVSQVSDGKRKVAWAWCARHAQWGKARKWSFGCVSRGGIEHDMVCGQAVFFTRLSRRVCLALYMYARFMLAWETRKSSACCTRLFNRMKKLTEDRKFDVVNIYFEHTAYKLH